MTMEQQIKNIVRKVFFLENPPQVLSKEEFSKTVDEKLYYAYLYYYYDNYAKQLDTKVEEEIKKVENQDPRIVEITTKINEGKSVEEIIKEVYIDKQVADNKPAVIPQDGKTTKYEESKEIDEKKRFSIFTKKENKDSVAEEVEAKESDEKKRFSIFTKKEKKDSVSEEIETKETEGKKRFSIFTKKDKTNTDIEDTMSKEETEDNKDKKKFSVFTKKDKKKIETSEIETNDTQESEELSEEETLKTGFFQRLRERKEEKKSLKRKSPVKRKLIDIFSIAAIIVAIPALVFTVAYFGALGTEIATLKGLIVPGILVGLTGIFTLAHKLNQDVKVEEALEELEEYDEYEEEKEEKLTFAEKLKNLFSKSKDNEEQAPVTNTIKDREEEIKSKTKEIINKRKEENSYKLDTKASTPAEVEFAEPKETDHQRLQVNAENFVKPNNKFKVFSKKPKTIPEEVVETIQENNEDRAKVKVIA